MIRLESITKEYKVKISKFNYINTYALNNITTKFMDNIISGITGSSGSGKTTIANIITNYDKDYSGKVFYDNKIEKDFNYIRYVFQDPYISLNSVKTVEWHIKTAAEINNIDIKTAIDKFNITDIEYENYKDKYVNTLSGGEMQKLAFAISIIPSPKYIVLDEAFSMLDSINLFYMLSLLKKIKKEISIIYIDHDINRVSFVSDYIYIMNNGKIIEENYTDKIIGSPQKDYTKDLIKYSPNYNKRI